MSNPRGLELADAAGVHRGSGTGARLDSIEVVTADANVFDVERRFDRVVSVEMLEHARNYEALLGKIAGWLEPGGKLFVHVFSHRELAYAYESGWMAKHFFTAGTMPSHDLIPHFAGDARARGAVGCERAPLRADGRGLAGAHGRRPRRGARRLVENLRIGTRERRLRMWRIFFMACAELWGYRSGSEWGVSHYRFARP